MSEPVRRSGISSTHLGDITLQCCPNSGCRSCCRSRWTAGAADRLRHWPLSAAIPANGRGAGAGRPSPNESRADIPTPRARGRFRPGHGEMAIGRWEERLMGTGCSMSVALVRMSGSPKSEVQHAGLRCYVCPVVNGVTTCRSTCLYASPIEHGFPWRLGRGLAPGPGLKPSLLDDNIEVL